METIEDRQAFIDEASKWSRNETAWILDAIIRDVTAALPGAAFLGVGTSQLREETSYRVLRELCFIFHTMGSWKGDISILTEKDALEMLSWWGYQSPSWAVGWTDEIGRYLAIAARQRVLYCPHCPISAALARIKNNPRNIDLSLDAIQADVYNIDMASE